MVLLYKASTHEGKIVRGIIEARDVQEAANYLRNHKLLPISITEHKDNPLSTVFSFKGKVSRADLTFVTRQIASMLTSGLTLVQSLNILRDQIKKKAV